MSEWDEVREKVMKERAEVHAKEAKTNKGEAYQAIAYELSTLVKAYGIDEVVNVINEEFGELIVELRGR